MLFGDSVLRGVWKNRQKIKFAETIEMEERYEIYQ